MANNVFMFGQKSTMSAAVNDMSTLGLGLDLESRYQEAEKVCFLDFKVIYVSFRHVRLKKRDPNPVQ